MEKVGKYRFLNYLKEILPHKTDIILFENSFLACISSLHKQVETVF